MTPASRQAAPKTETSFLPAGARLLQRKCACGNHTPTGEVCPACVKNRFGLQRTASGESTQSEAPPIVHDVLRSPGEALDPSARAFFEPRFDRDFSQVRVHTDAMAATSARAVDALAYTVGRHVVFGSSQYEPATPTGQRLLAHELAHVAQQNASPHSPETGLRIGPASDRWESEADRAAQAVVAGQAHGPLDHAPRNLARQGGGKKKCPSTHTIPDDIYKAMGEAWSKSGQAGATVTEHGGRVVTDSAGKRAIRTGSGGGGSISLPAEEAGDVTLGTFHTHPYSKSEGSKLGVSFSGGDIENFIAGGQGSVKYVHGGSCIFIMDTRDASARDGCKSVDVKKRWDDKFAAAGGNFQLKVDAAVRSAIAGCGLCYYGVCRPDAKSPVPKSAKLASG